MKKTTKNINTSQIHNKTSLHNNQLQIELQELNHSLNIFLRKQFKVAICPESFHLYLKNVQDLFVNLTTSKISTLISSLFSKIGNILQPFINHNYLEINDQIRHQIAKNQEKCKKYKKKIKLLQSEIQEHQKKSNKIMRFIYQLRVNNINIDKLYELSISNADKSLQFQSKQKNVFLNKQKKNFFSQMIQQKQQEEQLLMVFKKKNPVFQNQKEQINQSKYHQQQKIKISTNQTNRSKSKKITSKSVIQQFR